MTTIELIRALREKQSRDNRALLDEAANTLELLLVENERLEDRVYELEEGEIRD